MGSLIEKVDAAGAKLPRKLSPALAYVVGALRDGTISTSGGKYEVSFAQKDVRWLVFIRQLLLKLFRPTNTPKILRHKNCSPRLFISNKGMAEFLSASFDVPKGDKMHWNTPSVIKSAPWEIRRFYIAGFFDADGVIRNDGRLGFCQANPKALEEVRGMLEEKGIRCCPLTYQPRNRVYYFNVRKKANEMFVSRIGSYNIAKRSRFKSFRRRTKRRETVR